MPVQNVIVRAPGKVILHGEHAVVYGKMAIAAAVNGYMEVELLRKDRGGILFNVGDSKEGYLLSVDSLNEVYEKCCTAGNMQENEAELKNTIKDFVSEKFSSSPNFYPDAITVCLFCYFKTLVCREDQLDFPSLHINVKSHNLPLGAGLGSSAAFSVALATALFLCGEHFVPVGSDKSDLTLDKSSLLRINDLAFSLEQIVHGNPSGVDNSVSTYGGAVKFESKQITHLRRFPELRILVVDSGVGRNTKAMVKNVKTKVDKIPNVMKPLLASLHEICVEAENLFSNKSENFDDNFKVLVETNQHILNAIGVGHPSLDNIQKISSKHGFVSKLTGAGGGGCMFVYLPSDTKEDRVQNLSKELSENGLKSWEVTLGCPGVKVLKFEETR